MPAWTIPRDEWAGEAAFILGGGPSLRGFDPVTVRGRGRVIGVNDAGLHMAPWADVLYFSDRRWLDWNFDKLHLHYGRWKVMRKVPQVCADQINWVSYVPGVLSDDHKALGGSCSGSSAINLAYLLGARTIILLGFDMRPGNWHDNHQLPPARNSHSGKFVPTLERMAPKLAERGVRVLNATPGSALTCFPMIDLMEWLNGRTSGFGDLEGQ